MSRPLYVVKPINILPSMILSTSVPEDANPAYNAGTTYGLGQRCHLTSTHKVYESLQAGNVGHAPNDAASIDWWKEVGDTNRYLMLDGSVSTQTVMSGATSYYEFKPGQAFSALALVNVTGITRVVVTVTDPAAGVVYSKSMAFAWLPAGPDWYSWFFNRRFVTLSFLRDIPSYPLATVRVDFEGAGGVGVLLLGQLNSMGMGIQNNARIRFQSYSIKQRNEWGDTVLKKRANSRTISLSLLCENDKIDEYDRLVSELDGVPCLFSASDGIESLTRFGFISSFDILIPYERYSEASLEMESLT